MESVKSLGAANEFMKKIAAEKPGAYFVFSPIHRTVLSIVDTTYLMHTSELPEKNSGAA